MKLKKSKDETVNTPKSGEKEGKESLFSRFRRITKEKELSRQEKKRLQLEKAAKPTAKQRASQILGIAGQVLLVLFVIAVIFSMVALPLLVVFQ